MVNFLSKIDWNTPFLLPDQQIKKLFGDLTRVLATFAFVHFYHISINELIWYTAIQIYELAFKDF